MNIRDAGRNTGEHLMDALEERDGPQGIRAESNGRSPSLRGGIRCGGGMTRASGRHAVTRRAALSAAMGLLVGDAATAASPDGAGRSMSETTPLSKATPTSKAIPMSEVPTVTTIAVEHVTIRSAKDFETVKHALEAAVPPLDHSYVALLQAGRVDEARSLLAGAAPLSIFGHRDHGGLLRIAGLARKAVQYDIGNPTTASRMTRHVLSAALYAPIRVLLREDAEGAAFEYDRPASTFAQFGSDAVDAVARDLDALLRDTLIAAAS